MNNVLKGCSKVVSFVRRSTIATDLLEGENRLQADNVTRWNSQIIMIKSVLSIPESKLSMLEGTPQLTIHDWNVLKDILEILRFKRQQILYRLAVFHLLNTLSLV